MKIGAYLFVLEVMSLVTVAQQPNWQNKDIQRDSVFGVSTERVYEQLVKKRKSRLVVVAIIDSGIDTAHLDLRPVLWTSSKTGFLGWNYIGVETGREDITMLVGENAAFYDSLSYTRVPEKYIHAYQAYRRLTPILEAKILAMKKFIAELSQYNCKASEVLMKMAEHHLRHGLNINNLEADTAQGDTNVNPDILDPLINPNPVPYHGTHVAGIVGAVRGNEVGIDGIANNVRLMALKVNGNIRELRDKNLAKAIRFAVDNGARVINISMGKYYTWDKKVVDSAVRYAMIKDAIIIHGAGNDALNTDESNNSFFPTPIYADGSGRATAWLTVGASGPKDNESLMASFSNYGKNTVDVFAPGVEVCSTIPGNGYEVWSGTSMSAPVVAGIAALIRGYFPNLTAIQVKEIIMKSVVKRDVLKDKCVSGGVVNAYNALKLAATYK